MAKFYFTFGANQKHERHYCVIEADDWSAARDIMVSRYGREWSFQYTEDEWIIKPDDPRLKYFSMSLGLNTLELAEVTQAQLYGYKLLEIEPNE